MPDLTLKLTVRETAVLRDLVISTIETAGSRRADRVLRAINQKLTKIFTSKTASAARVELNYLPMVVKSRIDTYTCDFLLQTLIHDFGEVSVALAMEVPKNILSGLVSRFAYPTSEFKERVLMLYCVRYKKTVNEVLNEFNKK